MSTVPWYTSTNRVPAFLLHDTYREKWTPTSVNSSIDMFVHWGDRQEFITDMLGTHTSTPSNSSANPVSTTCCPNNTIGTQLTVSISTGGTLDGDYTLNYNTATERWEYTSAFGSASGFWIGCVAGSWACGAIGGATFTVAGTTPVCSPFSLIFDQVNLGPVGGGVQANLSANDKGGNAFGGGGSNIARQNPQVHPLYSRLFCVGCDIRQNAGVPIYDPIHDNWIAYISNNPTDADLLQRTAGPIYSCTFAALPYEVKSDAAVQKNDEGELIRYVVRSPKQVGEQIQALGQFAFASPPPVGSTAANPKTPIPTPPAIQAPYRQITYEWCLVPDPIFNVIDTADALYARVNNDFFDKNYGNYPPGTLMFLGGEYNRVPVSPNMNVLWNIRFSFAFRAAGWNRAYRPGNRGNNAGSPLYPDWDDVIQISSAGTALGPPYKDADFYRLFKV